MGSVVEKLSNFKQQDKLKRTARLAVSFGVSSTELKELGQVFSQMDADGDGLISMEEFCVVSNPVEMPSGPAKIIVWFFSRFFNLLFPEGGWARGYNAVHCGHPFDMRRSTIHALTFFSY